MRARCRIAKAELERRLAAGQSYPRIAADTGWTEHQIARRCSALGLPAPRSGAAPVVADEVLRELLARAGLSLRDIGRRVGVSKAAVHQRARRMGLPTRPAARATIVQQAAA
ncbi:AsnC family transcriptional regulator [Microvirga sp. 0TCS3.31]